MYVFFLQRGVMLSLAGVTNNLRSVLSKQTEMIQKLSFGLWEDWSLWSSSLFRGSFFLDVPCTPFLSL